MGGGAAEEREDFTSRGFTPVGGTRLRFIAPGETQRLDAAATESSAQQDRGDTKIAEKNPVQNERQSRGAASNIGLQNPGQQNHGSGNLAAKKRNPAAVEVHLSADRQDYLPCAEFLGIQKTKQLDRCQLRPCGMPLGDLETI